MLLLSSLSRSMHPARVGALRRLHTTPPPPQARSTWVRLGAIALPLAATGLYMMQVNPLPTETPEVVTDAYVPFGQRPALPPLGKVGKGDIDQLAKAHLSPIFSERVPDLLDLEGRPYRDMPWSDLLGRYAVFMLCSFPALIDAAPDLLDWAFATSIPGVKPVAEWMTRQTFFKQFVGDESSDKCIPLIQDLSQDDKATLFAFSVEMINNLDGTVADLDEMIAQSKAKLTGQPPRIPPKSKHIYHNVLQELIDSVTVGAKIAKQDDWRAESNPEKQELLRQRPARYGSALVAIKLSGILRDPSVLVRASKAIVEPHEFSASPGASTFPAFNVNGKPGSDAPGAGLPLPLSKLSKDDAEAMVQLWEGARKLCAHSQQAGPTVRLIVDAEYTAMQPALDAVTEGLQYEFNQIPSSSEAQKRIEAAGGQLVQGPLVFNTFQAYLRRTPAYLAASLERARKNGYALGIKLVRGAYYDQENIKAGCPATGLDSDSYHDQLLAVHRALGRRLQPPLDPATECDGWTSPIWPTKRLTDQSYDGCALALVDLLAKDIAVHSESWPHLSVIFASNNWQTDMKVLRRMLQRDLLVAPDHSITNTDQAERDFVGLDVAHGVRGRAMFGQLYGMSDVLTQRMTRAFDSASGGEGPHMVLKYVPYGPLALVMPYLVRRAIENKTVLHGAQLPGRLPAAIEERILFGREIRARLNPLPSS